MKFALDHAHREQSRHVLLCTVLQSVVTALGDSFIKNILIAEVLVRMDNLLKHDTDIVLLWVPGHVGIARNSKVNAAAKAGAVTGEVLVHGLLGADICIYLRQEILSS